VDQQNESITLTLRRACGALALLFLLASAMPIRAEGQQEGARTTIIKLLDLNNQGKLLSKPALTMLDGEAKSWHAASLGTFQAVPDKILHPNDRHAVARVQWRGQDRHTTDYYFYLLKDKDNIWKLEACRSLSSIGIVDEARKKLMAEHKLSDYENYQLSNMSLLLSSDAQLKDWFGKNRTRLDNLCRTARALPKPYPGVIKVSDQQHPKIAKMIESLRLDSIAMHDTGEIQAIIGGVNRDFVGLLNSSGGKRPEISQKSWIWVEDLGGNWFLFKHT
jgi:hypothetical protein